MEFVVITTTGARPLGFARCVDYMQRQTLSNVRWIVVDDGPRPSAKKLLARFRDDWEIDLIRPKPLWKNGENTQARNLSVAFSKIEDAAFVAIVEDDDWYAAEWLETLAGVLNEKDAAGEWPPRYYNVRTRGYETLSWIKDATCLRASGFARGGVAHLRNVVGGSPKFPDVSFYTTFKGELAFLDTVLTLGVKGVPGRGGIGAGHGDFKGRYDYDGSVLREWIGSDADRYSEFFEEQTRANDVMVEAIKPFTYAGRPVEHGDVFAVTRREERILNAIGKTRPAPARELLQNRAVAPAGDQLNIADR